MWRIWVVVWLSAVIFSAYYRISGMDEDATLGQKIRICVLWLPVASWCAMAPNLLHTATDAIVPSVQGLTKLWRLRDEDTETPPSLMCN